jgi:hypothetical protein
MCGGITIQGQVIDLLGLIFCLRNEQIKENAADTGVLPCQEGLVHNVIHRRCGYQKNPHEIRDLAGLHPADIVSDQ